MPFVSIGGGSSASSPDFPKVGQANPPPDAQPIQDDDWSKLPVGSWTAKGKAALKFPVEEIEEDGGNRLVFRARPYRPGVKIDSTGGKEKTWKISAFFSANAVLFEDGLDSGTPLYPDVLDALIDSFDVQETGDLVIPTRGKKRCRAHTYVRHAKADSRVGEQVTFVYVEDNEDSVDATSVTRPTMKGSGAYVAQAAQFDAAQGGAWNGTIDGLLDAINEFQGILNSPGEFLDDVRSAATALTRSIQSFMTTFSDQTSDAFDFFTDPASSRLARRLNRLMDMVAGAQYEVGTTTQPQTTQMSFLQDYSIYAIAALVRQDAKKLIDLNQYRIDDPLHIEAGTVILIFAS